MKKDAKKKKQKIVKETKYFKWGLTAFLVVVASMCFVFAINNADKISSGIKQTFKILTPIIDGLVIAYLLNPIVRFFEVDVLEKSYIKHNITVTAGRKKRFRVVSIILTFIIVGLLLYAFFGTVLPQMYTSIESIIIHFPTYYNNVIRSLDTFISNSDYLAANDLQELINTYSVEINQVFNESILPNMKDFIGGLKATDILAKLSSGVASVVGAVFNLIIGFIISIYLISAKEKYVGLIKKVIYSIFPREKANNILVDIRFVNATFGEFIVGKIVDSLIIGILCFIGLNILHMPYAVLVSVIVGITNIIPFFGPYLGAIPSAILILIVNPKQCLVFLIFVLILQQIDGNIIGPAILGNSIGISSFWIIVAITVFGGCFGIPGMIVGVPVFACVYAFVRRHINNRLKERNMPIGTYAYASADYMDSNNKIIPHNSGKNGKSKHNIDKNSPQYSRYVELNPHIVISEKKAEEKKWYNRVCEAIVSFANKTVICIGSLINNIKNKKSENQPKNNSKDVAASSEPTEAILEENVAANSDDIEE